MSTQPPPYEPPPQSRYGPQAVPYPPPPPPPLPLPPAVPPQPAYQRPPAGLLRVHIQGSVLTSSMIVPSLLLDGRPVPSRYGENAVPVPPGRHRVELYAQWMLRYGQALLDVDVAPGAAVDVFYAAPFHQFTTGSIGLAPQMRKGVGWLVASLVIAVAMIAFVFWAISGAW